MHQLRWIAQKERETEEKKTQAKEDAELKKKLAAMGMGSGGDEGYEEEVVTSV